MRGIIGIPAYNCGDHLASLVSDVRKEDPDVEEIVVIDNGSTDDSVANMLQHHGSWKKLTVFKNRENYGLGGSFINFYCYAKGKKADYVIWIHGDNQAYASDIKKAQDIFLGKGLDVVFGARFMKSSKLKGYQLKRLLGNMGLNVIVSLMLGKLLPELGSGLNIYRLSFLNALRVERWPRHIAFDMNFIGAISLGRFMYEFFPIKWRYEGQKSNAHDFKTGLKILEMTFFYLVRRTLVLEEAHHQEWSKV